MNILSRLFSKRNGGTLAGHFSLARKRMQLYMDFGRAPVRIIDEMLTLDDVESVLIGPDGNKNRGQLKGDLSCYQQTARRGPVLWIKRRSDPTRLRPCARPTGFVCTRCPSRRIPIRPALTPVDERCDSQPRYDHQRFTILFTLNSWASLSPWYAVLISQKSPSA